MEPTSDVKLVTPTPTQETEPPTENLNVCKEGDEKCFSRLFEANCDCV
jgi:hypothetical protein